MPQSLFFIFLWLARKSVIIVIGKENESDREEAIRIYEMQKLYQLWLDKWLFDGVQMFNPGIYF